MATSVASAASGLVSALGWLKEEAALPWLEHWLSRTDYPALQQIALRAYGIRRIMPSISINTFFNAAHASLCAAACVAQGYRSQHARRLGHGPAVVGKRQRSIVRPVASTSTLGQGGAGKQSSI